MSERQPYSRVYWSILHDPKFNDVRVDMRLMGAWTVLLVVADMAYPSPAFVPPTVPRKALEALAAAELVDVLPGAMFTLRGLKRERERRADAATRKPARPPNGTQLPPKRDPDGRVDEDETSTRQAEAQATREVPDPADVLWNLSGRYPTDKALGWVDDLTSSYGPEAVIRAVAKAHAQDSAGNTLLGRSQDILRAEARALSLKEQANVRQNLKERRAAPRTDIDPEALAAEIRRIREEAA